MDLLVRSVRIAEDLTKYLSYGNGMLPIQLVLREWNEKCVAHPEGEFRCFVGHNRLNAVTQYYSFMLFPVVAQRQEEIKQKLQKLFDERLCTALARFDSYVFDVWVDFSRPHELDFLIIELNPFHVGAGTGLFSWKADRELFLNGPANGVGFELRVCKELEKEPFNILPSRWQKFCVAERQQQLEQSKCILC